MRPYVVRGCERHTRFHVKEQAGRDKVCIVKDVDVDIDWILFTRKFSKNPQTEGAGYQRNVRRREILKNKSRARWVQKLVEIRGSWKQVWQ